MKSENFSEMTIIHLTDKVDGFNAVNLCDLPDSEFVTGGYFNEIAKRFGYSSGKSAANDLNLWQTDPISAIATIEGKL